MHLTPLLLHNSKFHSRKASRHRVEFECLPEGGLAAIGLLRRLLAECLCAPRVMPLVVIPIFSRSRMLELLAVGLVPLDGSANSVLEAHLWPPT